jgi:tellurite resistance protein TerC
LALVLIFIGAKMVADPWLHISVVLSLSVVGGILLLAMLISVLTRPVKKKEPGTG